MTGTHVSPAPTHAATDDSTGTSLEDRLADRTRELDELTRQHAATVEILDIIAHSPAGLQPVLCAVVRAAVRHCGADDATLFLREGSEVFGAAHEGPLPSGLGTKQRIERSHLQTLVIRDGQTIHAPDTEALDPVDFAPVIAIARQRGVRALVAAPIRHAGEGIGSLLLRRREVGPFTARQIAMLETFATQAGIAVANAGVITELRQSLEQQTATAEVLQVINASPGDTTPVFETILQKAHALCGIAYGSLQLYDGQKFRAVATHSLPEPLAMRLREGYVPGPNLRQLIDGAGFSQFPDIGLVDDPMAKAAAEGGIKTLLCVPLRTDGRLLGQIVCVRKEVRPFADREIALLQGFAAQAVIAMENARLITETREALEQQTATADILRVISQSPTDIGPVLRAVVSAALRFCGAEDAIVALRDGDESVTAAHEGPLGGIVGTRARLDPRGRGTVRAIVERRTIHVPDVAAPDQNEFAVWRDLAREQNFRAFVVAPMMREGVAIGSIGLRRPNPGPFTPRQIALLESFAAQAVIAIENVRLFTELREALDRQTAMAEVLAAINANPGELAPVFDTILEKAHRLCGSAIGNLSLYDGARLRRVAFRGMSGETSAMVAEPRNVSDLHGRLVRGERFVHVADLDAADSPRTESLTALRNREGIRSFVLVPLRREGTFLGYISANWAEPRSNVASEVALLESFADQAVIAMENARLLTETKEALERQTAMAEVLTVINASPGDLTPVFSTILDKALSLSGSSLGFLMRFDGEKFWLVAGRNTPPAVRDIALRGHMPEAGTLLHRLVLGDDVASLADIRDDEAYRAGAPSRVILADEGGARSQLIVALRKDGRLLGCIQIYRTEVRAFSEAEVTLVRAFADQAVIAMENARLLTETKEALERQAAMAEVLTVINASPGDLTPVFSTILDKALSLSGSSLGFLVRFEGEKLWLVAERNVPSAVRDIALSGVVPAAGTLLHRMVLGDDVAYVADITDDEAYRAGVPHRVVMADEAGARSLLAVALRKDGRLLGAIQVYRTEVRAFSEPEVTLVRSFADQAVIAMENARLISETREALERQTATAEVLQVINASPGDLEPVFEAILAKAHDLCGATMGSLNLFDGGINRAVATRGMDDAFSDFLRRGTPISGVLSREHTVQVADLADLARQNPDNPVWRAATELGRVRTMLGVPLVKDGNVLGRIIAARQEVRPFTESQIALLENFAAQAVIAMENARLLEQIRQRQAELRVTFDNMGDGVAMFDAELRLAAWNRNFERIIGVPEDRLADRPSYAQYLLLLAERGEFGTENVEAELAGRLEDTERELRLERTRADGTVIEVRRNAVPGGGFVLIYSDITQRRKAEAAIREARDAAEAALERQTATSEILHIISQSPTSVQPVFDFVVKAAVRLCGARDAIVVMRDGPEVVFEAHEGPVGGDRGARWPLDRDNAMGRAIIESRTVHIPDTTALGPGEFAGTQHGMTLYGFKAIVAAPLMREGGAIGALLLRKPEPGPFTPRQIELLESFAAQAVIAIQNVRLFNETKEALERQTATAEILSVISRSPTDVQPVFDAIAQSALRLLNGWSVLVWRYDGERMSIIASHGGVPGTDATSVRAALGEPRPEDLAYPGDAILKRAILQIADVEAAGVPEGVREVAHARGWRANIAVPMLHDGAPIGIITVSRKVPGAFAEREIGLLQTFAAQAVIAIQNVRLFNETKEALERQTATAEILSVISRSPTDVQPVFDAIVRRAAPLGNGLHAAFYRYDGALQHLVAHNNDGDEKFAEAIATLRTLYPRAPQRSTATGTALLDGAVVHVPNMQGDLRFTGGAYSASLVAGYRSALAVPLLKEGQAIGVIFVVRREAGLFSPEHIALLESFANQAVIAIENVRLFTELRDSLERLKAAQANLIQAEKMASLGQLTAGIAHEIKNPLNFVNNFADLSAELVGELREALDPARTELGAEARADVDELTEMLTANLAKVSQHGRRADSIVKNMLLHSREGGGERRRVDLNASVEESLNLAYHGARAEKPGFNMTLEKDLDPAVGEVELYPQEFVRALLNLISNGFYAAHQRKIASADATFEPTLRVTTRALGDRAEIRIRDNGTGIPDAVKEKIFNPFFTTKPAGEGTGLGLSLSFDIVVKQHGGTIDVETEPGVFTEFILTVPRQLAAGAAPATVRLP